MKRRNFITTSAGIGLASVVGHAAMAGPAAHTGPAPAGRVVYTNIGDAQTLRKAQSLLRNAGVSARRITVFSKHVEQVRQTLPRSALATGFEDFATRKPKFDPYDLQEIWQAKHPRFSGYNCRITAFGLWSQQMRLGKLLPINDSRLFMDLESLQADPSAMTDKNQLYRFRTLYGRVPTVASTDPARHLTELQKDWHRRRLTMSPNPHLKLVSVIQHDKFEADELFVGHTGLLLPAKDGLWFLEKLAFQQPYQLTRFVTRTQLNDYLMQLYDIDTTGTTAAPLVLEDQALLKGYRRIPH